MRRTVPYPEVGRSIAYEQVDKKNNPDIIRTNNKSEYIVYSSLVRGRVSGDSLILFNKRNMSTIEIIPRSEINEIIVISDIKKDSPLFLIITSILFWII